MEDQAATGVRAEDPTRPATLEHLPEAAQLVSLLGESYIHCRTPEGGDLYVVAEALPLLELLKPANWFESAWFEQHRVRLRGTSTVYSVDSRPVQGESLRLVVKYCRVGQQPPLDTHVLDDALHAEFNGPFEEFSLVEELRRSTRGTADAPIHFHTPLAIYVPPERMQLWQTGRSESKIACKLARHPGVAIDILRDYLLVYRWLDGLDAVQAYEKGALTQAEMEALTRRACAEIASRGYRVLDMKPDHLIVQLESSGRLHRWNGGPVEYGVVDFELLERTPEYEEEVKTARRREYLQRQKLSFAEEAPPRVEFPPHLAPQKVFDVDYVYGRVESTGGALWVAGQDPGLFDFFLPERWRQTPRIRLNPDRETYFTRTKDNVELVWKVSRVGEPEYLDCTDADDWRALRHGVNSPFEEFAIAHILRRAGVPTSTPRAIYMTGHQSHLEERTLDWRRYRSHERIVTPDGEPVLRPGRDYITLWGYWGGPELLQAGPDDARFRAVNAQRARAQGLLSQQVLDDLVAHHRSWLSAAGIEVLKLLPRQLLLSLDGEGNLVGDDQGGLVTRLCNFDFLKLPAELSGLVGDAEGYVPPGIHGYEAGVHPTDLYRLLKEHREALAASTLRRVVASGAPHYARVQAGEVQSRIRGLAAALVESVRPSRHALVDHVRRITEDRVEEGFGLGEIQMALGCLEEEVWRLCIAQVPDRLDLVRCLGIATGIVGQAKDELARVYLERKVQGDAAVRDLQHRLEQLFPEAPGAAGGAASPTPPPPPAPPESPDR